MPEPPKPLASSPRALPPGAPSLHLPIVFAVLLGAAAAALLALVAPKVPEALRRGEATPFFALGGGLAIAFGVSVALLGWVLNARRLLHRGAPLAGRVLWSRRRGDTLQVHYTFTTPAGRELERDYYLGDGGIRRFGISPAGGDVVWLVYDPKRPRRFVLWGFTEGDGRVRPNSATGVPVVS